MKTERLFTLSWAAGLSFLLGLGAVGAMASGLDLPVELPKLVLLCAIMAVALSVLLSFRHGIWLAIAAGAALCFSDTLRLQLKTVAAFIMDRLTRGYGIPAPEFLEGELSSSVLLALCVLAAVVMLLCTRAVIRQKSCVTSAVAAVLPLLGCITVIDTVPETPWLFLWALGLILLLMTQGVRRDSPRQGNRLTALLALPTAAALVLLFLLIPRDAPEQWNLFIPDLALTSAEGASGPGTDTQLKEQVDLTDLGKQTREQTPVMEVTADFSGQLYLRSRDYDQYSGTGWSSTENRTEELYGFAPEWNFKSGEVRIKVSQPRDYYVLPAYTQEVQLITGGKAENPLKQRTYRFDHCTLREDWQQSWEDPLTSTVNPRYLKLPDGTGQGVKTYFSGQGKVLAAALSEATLPERAELIRAAVSATAPYNLATPNMPEGETDLAMWFLNQAETGYCVHYATAAAVLLRGAGIPSRYVEGYLIRVEKGKTATVREMHAHAWVEYYVNGIGWVVLEATPSGGTAPEALTPTEPSVTPEEETTTAPEEETTSPHEDEPTTEPSPDHSGSENTVHNARPAAWVGTALVWAAGLCLGCTVVLGQYWLRRQLLKRAIRRDTNNRRGLAMYRQLRRLSRFLKQPVSQELTQLAQKARFSPHTLTDRELKALAHQLRKAELAAAGCPLHLRLLARWILALY